MDALGLHDLRELLLESTHRVRTVDAHRQTRGREQHVKVVIVRQQGLHAVEVPTVHGGQIVVDDRLVRFAQLL